MHALGFDQTRLLKALVISPACGAEERSGGWGIGANVTKLRTNRISNIVEIWQRCWGGRGGAGDFFPLYSAAGRRNGTARVYSYALPAAPYGADAAAKVFPRISCHALLLASEDQVDALESGAHQRSNVGAAVQTGVQSAQLLGCDVVGLWATAHQAKLSCKGCVGHKVCGTVRTSQGANGHAGGFLQEGPCPVAVLVGLDATPDPGLRGPTNFAGVLHGQDLRQLDAELARHSSR